MWDTSAGAPGPSRSIAAALPRAISQGGNAITRPWLRRVGAAILAITLAVGLAACSGDGEGSEREQAQQLLQEALQAHAQGDLAEAERTYLEVIRLDPQNKFAYYNLGVIHHGRGELVEAAARYRTAIRIDPDFVAALFNLAIARTGLGDDDEAIELYEQIIELEPENASAHLNLGFVLIEQGSERRGRAELEEAIRLDPSLESRVGPETSSPEPTAG
jgi:tetratricopeptide (TPR) repeat protein